MARQGIDIELRADGRNAVAEVGKVDKSLHMLGGSVKQVGGMFGGFGSVVGGVLANLARGSIWGAAAEAVRGLVGAVKGWWDGLKDRIAEHERAAGESVDKLTAKIGEYRLAWQELAAAEGKAIEAGLKARQSELDLTNRLTKATVELARQKRIAAGEDAATANAEADNAAAAADAETARKKSDADINAATRRVDAAEKARDDAWAEVEHLREARRMAVDPDSIVDFEAEAKRKAAKFRKEIDKKILEAKNAAFEAEKKLSDEEKALEKAEKSRDALEQELEARDLAHDNGLMAESRKAAEDLEAAEVAAAKAAAEERERLDRELHKKRMDDLRAEIAKQKESASPLQAAAAAAKTEFERAFAMYRSPDQAAAQIAEERDYAADLKRLRKDASRYGGKWRIDELSSLMAAGDSAGVQSRLEDWRKSKSFTPEVEAMVRASAAERTKTTAEDELRKIEHNTANLGQKLDELLAMKN